MVDDHGWMDVLCCLYLIQRAVFHPEASCSVNGPICITGNQLRGRQSDTFKIRRLINHDLGQPGREGGQTYIVSLTTEEQPEQTHQHQETTTRATPSIEQIRNNIAKNTLHFSDFAEEAETEVLSKILVKSQKTQNVLIPNEAKVKLEVKK